MLESNTTNGPSLMDEASSAINPTLVPDKATPGAGVGGTSGSVDLITGDTSRVKISSDGNTVTIEDKPAWQAGLDVDAAGTAVAMAIALA